MAGLSEAGECQTIRAFYQNSLCENGNSLRISQHDIVVVLFNYASDSASRTYNN